MINTRTRMQFTWVNWWRCLEMLSRISLSKCLFPTVEQSFDACHHFPGTKNGPVAHRVYNLSQSVYVWSATKWHHENVVPPWRVGPHGNFTISCFRWFMTNSISTSTNIRQFLYSVQFGWQTLNKLSPWIGTFTGYHIIPGLKHPSAKLLDQWATYFEIISREMLPDNLIEFWKSAAAEMPMSAHIAQDSMWISVPSAAVERSFSNHIFT